MRHTVRRTLTISMGAVALLGCASGIVTGRVTGPGQPVAPLDMTWRSGLFGESGTMTAVMPDGERFSGTYTVVRPGTSWKRVPPAWRGDEPASAQGQIDAAMWGAPEGQLNFVSAHLNKAVATLKGDRGSTMQCRFALDDGAAGMGGGGSGLCQTSQGVKITARF